MRRRESNTNLEFDSEQVVTDAETPNDRSETRTETFNNNRQGKLVKIASAFGITAASAAMVISYSICKDFPGSGSMFDWLQARQMEQYAISLQKQGKVDLATDRLKDAIAVYPDDPKMYRNLAELYVFDSSNWKLAEGAVRQAILLDDKSSDSWRLLSFIQFWNGQAADAERSARKAIQRRPYDQRNAAMLGLILLSSGDKTGRLIAEDAYNRDKNNAEVAYILSLVYLYEVGDDERAEHFAREAVRWLPIWHICRFI